MRVCSHTQPMERVSWLVVTRGTKAAFYAFSLTHSPLSKCATTLPAIGCNWWDLSIQSGILRVVPHPTHPLPSGPTQHNSFLPRLSPPLVLSHIPFLVELSLLDAAEAPDIAAQVWWESARCTVANTFLYRSM